MSKLFLKYWREQILDTKLLEIISPNKGPMLPILTQFHRIVSNMVHKDCSLIKDTKQKYAFIKKSTILTQSLRNFVKIRYS